MYLKRKNRFSYLIGDVLKLSVTIAHGYHTKKLDEVQIAYTGFQLLFITRRLLLDANA